jgi:hypothetical protein
MLEITYIVPPFLRIEDQKAHRPRGWLCFEVRLSAEFLIEVACGEDKVATTPDMTNTREGVSRI